MTGNILRLEVDPIGKGKERSCFLYPEDNSKVIKINHTETTIQTKRETRYYQQLNKRKIINFSNIPRYYGKVETNFGTGHIYDCIRDHSGKISQSLLWYFKEGMTLKELSPCLNQLKTYFIDNRIIFNHDMYEGNILLQKISPQTQRLVVIDGLGDTVLIPFLNYLPSHVISKINRRWERFIKRLHENYNSTLSVKKTGREDENVTQQ